MLNPKLLDELTQSISQLIPQDIKILKEDAEQNIRLAVQGALSKLDLVTREEFDIQAKVLAKTRDKLNELEAKLSELEKQ